MTTTNLPPMQTTPAAMLYDDNVWRAALRKPLFSSAGFDNAALPQEVRFFGYGRGQNVPGAGNASGVPSRAEHTNMEIGGQLAKPKKFRCDGVGVSMLPMAFGSSDVPTASDPTFNNAATQDSDLLEDLLLFTYSTFLEIKVGEKFYARHPMWMFPINIGFSGIASVANDTVSASAVGTLDISFPHTVGLGINFATYPFLIEDSQGFYASIRCPLPGTPPSLIDDRLVTVILWGNMYREVQ